MFKGHYASGSPHVMTDSGTEDWVHPFEELPISSVWSREIKEFSSKGYTHTLAPAPRGEQPMRVRIPVPLLRWTHSVRAFKISKPEDTPALSNDGVVLFRLTRQARSPEEASKHF